MNGTVLPVDGGYHGTDPAGGGGYGLLADQAGDGSRTGCLPSGRRAGNWNAPAAAAFAGPDQRQRLSRILADRQHSLLELGAGP